MEHRDDLVRQFIDSAMSYGRLKQSEQTGYVQYCHHVQDEENRHTIPIYENLLFALALFRSRKADNILEAKGHLEKLLWFQNYLEDPSRGNFPIYLHEYPHCKDRYLGFYLLAPFYWILKDFHTVIGQELHQRLVKSVKILIEYCLQTHQQKPAPYFLGIRFAAATQAFGTLLQDSELQKTGEELMKGFSPSDENIALYTPSQIADILVALQMIYPSVINSPWKSFWSHIENTWHHQSLYYAGPGLKEFQEKEEPQVTLYDYFLGYFSGSLSYRTFGDHISQMQAALIQSTEDRFSSLTYPLVAEGTINSRKWFLFQNEKLAYSALEKLEEMHPAVAKGFYPLKMIWGDRNCTHTLVSQDECCSKITFHPNPDGLDIYFYLEHDPVVDDREKNREVAFYFDTHEGAKFSVENQTSTTFQLDEKVLVQSQNVSFSLKFHLEEGEGQFFGHIMPGNRLSQLCLKGKNRFKAFDWQIFFRTVRRSKSCRIKVTMSVVN